MTLDEYAIYCMPIPTEARPPRPLLRDDVLDRIRDAIVDGTLTPGEQVRDADLATWLGVSRTPVREALLELGRAGLVRSSPGRSTVVSPLESDDVRDAQRVVAAMHRLAVLTAVPRMTAVDLDRMRAANARFAAAHAAGDAAKAMSHWLASLRALSVELGSCSAAVQYEWGGIFTTPGTSYKWVAQAVDGAYADPEMKMVLFALDESDADPPPT